MVKDNSSALTVVVPARRSAVDLVASTAGVAISGWLLWQMWPLAKAYARAPSAALGDLMLMGFVLAFVLAGINSTYGMFFTLFGTEKLSIEGQKMLMRRTIGSLGHRAAYDLNRVEHLRVLDLSHGPFVHGIAIGRSRNGLLAFDYGGRIVRFGDDLAVPEAVYILDLVRSRAEEELSRSGAV